jgi:hypothetical protein
MKSIFFSVFLLSIVFFGACKKATDDIASPVVTILSPLQDTQHSSADSLLLHVVVEDEDLHDYRVTVRYYVDGELCCTSFDIKRHDHEKVVEYRRMLAPQTVGQYNMAVYAVDHNGNETTVAHNYEVK